MLEVKKNILKGHLLEIFWLCFFSKHFLMPFEIFKKICTVIQVFKRLPGVQDTGSPQWNNEVRKCILTITKSFTLFSIDCCFEGWVEVWKNCLHYKKKLLGVPDEDKLAWPGFAHNAWERYPEAGATVTKEGGCNLDRLVQRIESRQRSPNHVCANEDIVTNVGHHVVCHHDRTHSDCKNFV